jgi:membrane fusion protein, multidrug efflux system
MASKLFYLRLFWTRLALFGATLASTFGVSAAGVLENQSILARGIFRSVNEAAIATELAARVSVLPFHESERFSKGAVLVEFECDKLRADLKAAEAEYRSREVAYNNSHDLQSMRAAGGLDVAMARALSDKAAAAVEAAEVRVGECRILAPFAGRIVELLTHVHDMSTPNSPVMRIVDDQHLEIDLMVPSNSLQWLREGTEFIFRIDETGTAVPAAVLRTGAAVDPISQTVKVTGSLRTVAAGILPGMSGTAVFDRSRE